MRILQVIQSLKLGGAERVCMALSTELVKLGHEVRIVLLQDCQLLRKPDSTIDLDIRPLVYGSQPIWVRSIPQLSPAFHKQLADNWDVVHCHMDGALTIAFLGGAKRIVYTVHNSRHGHWEGSGLHRIRSFFEWTITQRKNVIVTACGPGAKNWSDTHLVIGDRTICVPNGICVADFPFTKNPWQALYPLRILMVGKLSDTKNHEMALRALGTLLQMKIDVELHLVGSGSEEHSLRTIAHELRVDNRVEFHGASTDTLKHYQQASLFWLTSRHEGLPIVLLEAAAVGLPIIATNVPGIKELFTDLNIFSVAAEDHLRLAELTSTVLSMPEALESIRQSNRLKIERLYSSARMAQDYIDIYSSIL